MMKKLIVSIGLMLSLTGCGPKQPSATKDYPKPLDPSAVCRDVGLAFCNRVGECTPEHGAECTQIFMEIICPVTTSIRDVEALLNTCKPWFEHATCDELQNDVNRPTACDDQFITP